jgi:cellulose synthase/poly-beta-1,6-N-acetylglucosamine synthase-like glycosyltransferase
MFILQIVFWSLLALVIYSYVGYGIVLYLLVSLKRIFNPRPKVSYPLEWPTVTLLIASYNELDFLPQKVKNCQELTYQSGKLRILFVTDGSSDGSESFLSSQNGIEVLHQGKRAGKIMAMNRGMEHVNSEIVVFTDANTLLNTEAIQEIVKHFVSSEKVGCVAGAKRILLNESESASGAGEGAYWKYESALKKWDSELNTVVGAAGELFSIRRSLFKPVEKDTLLDDFMISMRIAQSGYRVVYEPAAMAFEKPTADVKEEMKRKVRICAGGIQSIIRLAPVLNVFKYGLLSFQYISHRVLRWSVTPIAMALLIPINLVLVVALTQNQTYFFLLIGQCLFYGAAIVGSILQEKKLKSKFLFIPYFFLMQNISVFQGMARYYKGSQSVLWEKAKRA